MLYWGIVMSYKQCKANTTNGTRCSRCAKSNSDYCTLHHPFRLNQNTYMSILLLSLPVSILGKLQGIGGVVLKAIIAGYDDLLDEKYIRALLKIPATFVAELAGMDTDKLKSIRQLDKERFEEMMQQSELATWNAAKAASNTTQLLELVQKLSYLGGEYLKALQTLNDQQWHESINSKLDSIKADTTRLKDDHSELKDIAYATQHNVEKLTSRLNETIDRLEKTNQLKSDIIAALKVLALQTIREKDIPEEQWPESILLIADSYQKDIKKGPGPDFGNNEIAALQQKAFEAKKDGDYDKADKFLIEAGDLELAKQTKSQIARAAIFAERAEMAHTKLKYQDAISLYQDAIDILPQSQQETLADYLNVLGYIHDEIGEYIVAEPLYKKSQAICQSIFGDDHSQVAIRLNNLAQLYQATNRLKEAEPLMVRTLKIDEDSYGPEHPDVAIDLNNLAQLYQATNRLKEAEPLMIRALEIDEKSLGPNHPDVAIDLSNLAHLYKATNRFSEAEPLMIRALEIDEILSEKTILILLQLATIWHSCIRLPIASKKPNRL